MLIRSLSVIIYNLSILFYGLTIYFSYPFNKRARKWINGRKNVFDVLKKSESLDGFKIWIHVSSLGEFEQGRPIIDALKSRYPKLKIILTFFSPSGFEIRNKYPGADIVSYLPLDTKSNARNFIELVQPDLALFIKYDFWYHYFHTLKKSKIPLILVSSVFRKEQIFFKSYGLLFRDLLRIPDHIFVQNENSISLLQEIDITNTSVIGDTRTDRVIQISNTFDHSAIKKAHTFKGKSKILILGSSYQTEENLIVKALDGKLQDWKIIIAPHQVNSDRIHDIKETFKKFNFVIWSQNTDDEQLNKAQILIVDTVGLLNQLYSLSEIAFIGGGFNKSIHNLLEPATFGNAIIFGSNGHQKFIEAIELINNQGAIMLDYPDSFMKHLADLINQNNYLNYGERAKKYINDHSGGTEIVLDYIDKFYLVDINGLND